MIESTFATPVTIARVAIENIPYTADILYSYIIPEELQSKILIGCLVYLPFGRNDRKTRAVIIDIHQIDIHQIDIHQIDIHQIDINKTNICHADVY
ncbi:MAG: hypothetical protein K0S55_1729, partial [Clostridia bacterium]|nr:hypothetical protein [Clostridia bacterium]